jgi:hypothetical protein
MQSALCSSTKSANALSGEPLLTLHANDRAKCDAAKTRLLAYEFSDTEPRSLQLIHKVVK